MIYFNRVWIGPRNTSRRYFGHQITWYFAENTDLRVDRYCMRLTINLDYDKNGPLRGPQTTGSAIPRLKSGACTEEFRSRLQRWQDPAPQGRDPGRTQSRTSRARIPRRTKAMAPARIAATR